MEVVEWLYITLFAKRCAGLAGKWAINKYTVYGISYPQPPRNNFLVKPLSPGVL